jgi:hypothetical protein
MYSCHQADYRNEKEMFTAAWVWDLELHSIMLYNSVNPQSVLGQVHSPFQSHLSTQCNLVLPLSISSILSVSIRSSNSFLLLLPSLPVTPIHPTFHSILCFRRQFLRKMWPIQSAFLLFTVCMIFLSSFTPRNTFSFLTRSVQLIFSVFLQHHISKLSGYFWSTICVCMYVYVCIYIYIYIYTT